MNTFMQIAFMSPCWGINGLKCEFKCLTQKHSRVLSRLKTRLSECLAFSIMRWSGSGGAWVGMCAMTLRKGVSVMFPAHHLLHVFSEESLPAWTPLARGSGRHMQWKPAPRPRCHSTSGKGSERSGSHVAVICHSPSIPFRTELLGETLGKARWSKQIKNVYKKCSVIK